jgi:hypothetical protein
MEFIQGIYTYLYHLLCPPPSNLVADYITLLPRFLPPSIASPLLTVFTSAFGILRAVQTHFSPLITKILTQPDVASILALLAILLISLKILDMAYRAVIFWVKLVVRLVMWGTMVGIGFWVWNRGVDGFVEDVRELGQYWWTQYERFAGDAKGWQKAEEAQIRFQAGQHNARGYGRRGGW